MRYEIKYQIALVDRYMIEQAILAHPASFITAFPDRQINNIYYDTADLKSFYQNVDGDPERKKIRFRWYDNQELTKGKLEIKKKHGALGTKEFPAVTFTDRNDLDQAIINATQLEVNPTLINQYHRAYYISMDGKFRITVDQDIKFIDPNFKAYRATEKDVILEIKFEKEDFENFKKVYDFLPFRQSKYSKYVNGLIKLKA